MTLRLSLENVDRLPDGGPVRIEIKGRGLDIGRDAHLDWTLPDPSRHVSGKHCEIRFRDGGYWLHDVSTNGTFVNGATFRVEGPRLLRTGDRLAIGPYLVAVEVEGQVAASAAPAYAPMADAGADVWGAVGEAAAPDDRNAYRPKQVQQAPPDFLDFASSLAPSAPAPRAFAATNDHDDWLSVPPRANSIPPPPPLAPPPPSPFMPSPRRPAAATPFDEPAQPAPTESLTMPPSARSAAVAAPSQSSPFAAPAPPAPIAETSPFAAPPPPAPAAQSSPFTAPPPAAQPSPFAAQAPPAPIAQPTPFAAPAPAAPFAPPAPFGAPSAAAETIARIAAAAGLPESAFAGRDPNEVAVEIGAVLRATASNLAQLLGARAETKSQMRAGGRTMIRVFENNPLKFTPTPEDALKIMFGPRTRNYLDAVSTVERSFADLKSHEVLTLAAMQGALEALFDDLAPEKIDASAEPERGLGALVGSRKSKLWDIYTERWRAKSKRSDGRLTEAFTTLFADAYNRLNAKDG